MTVGVITPVHGDAPWLGEALGSVLAQSPPPDVVVVVDDASPEPLSLPPELAAACRLLRRDAQGGPGAARATGLAALDTDLVALADGDDVWLPGRLRAAVAALEHHPEAAVCFGRAEIIGPDGAPTGERWPEPSVGVLGPDAFGPMLFEANPIPTSSAVMRRLHLEEVGGFGENLPPTEEDLDLWLRLVRRGRPFVYEPEAGIRYRRHPDAMTADVIRVAEAGLRLHARYADLVSAEVASRARARDLRALGRGRIRQRRYAEARRAFAEASPLDPPSSRDRAVAALAAVPGLRRALGRRDPYGQR